MTKLTENGVSTTQGRDVFAYEKHFYQSLKRHVVLWDYRDTNGELHTGTAKTLEEAKEKAAKYGYKA